MSSPGWETVVSSKTSKSTFNKGKNAASAAAKKKFVEKAPKLEDVLPIGQINSIYNSVDAQYQNPPQPPPSSPSKGGKKKAGKATAPKSKDPPKASSKPKTLEEAVQLFSVKSFKESLSQVKALYSGSHLLWQREAASFLNETLATSEVVIDPSSKSFDPFAPWPLSAISKETKKTLTSLLEEVDESDRRSGFETLLANLGHEAANDSGVNGHLVVLQLMVELYPTFTFQQNCKRAQELIRSYQNRPSVCLSLLWVLGQAGRKDLSIGIKVWCDYMRPLIRMKHYSRFVVHYLRGLLSHHHVPENMQKLRDGPRVVYPEQFFLTFDTIFTEAQGSLSKELAVELTSVYPVFKDLAIGDCTDDHELFPEFLRRLDDTILLSGTSKSYEDVLLSLLAECVANNQAAVISHWQQMYRAHFQASLLLLQKLVVDYDKVLRPSKHFSPLQGFDELVAAFLEHSDGCSSVKGGVEESREACTKLLIKMTQPSSKAWFPWKTLMLLLVLGIGAVVKHDVQRKGSFAVSNTGHFLKDIGLYNQTVDAYGYGVEAYMTGRTWAEEKLPVYYSKVKEAGQPHVAKFNDSARWAFGELRKLGTFVAEKANDYIPGAKEKIFLLCDDAEKVIKQSLRWIGIHGNNVLEVLQYMVVSAHVTAQDVIDGKIELKDVSNGIRKLGVKAFDKLEEVRRGIIAK